MASNRDSGDDAIRSVVAERERQEAKWGEQDLDDGVWSLILTEEVGEACQAALHDRFGGPAAGKLREELVHAAAVAVQWIEAIDRRNRVGSERRNEIAAGAVETADHFNGGDTRV